MSVMSAIGYSALVAFVAAAAIYINILVVCWFFKAFFGAIFRAFR
jgi:hypothetical protein